MKGDRELLLLAREATPFQLWLLLEIIRRVSSQNETEESSQLVESRGLPPQERR